MNRLLVTTTCLLVSFGSYASSEEVSEILDSCMAELEIGDQVDARYFFDKLKTIPESNMSDEQIEILQACSKGAFGTRATYAEQYNVWVPNSKLDAFVAQKEKEAAEIKKELDQRLLELHVNEKIYNACVALSERDEVQAFTNTLCVQSFKTNGLPE